MNLWSDYQRALCLPDDCGCEFVHLNTLIAQPSAFWSSLFHIIFALYLYRSTKEKSQGLKLWIFSLFLLAFASHFAHASFLEFAMAVDFAGIVLVMSFFPLYRLLRNRILSTSLFVLLLLMYQAGLWMIFYSLEKWFKVEACAVIFLVATGELIYYEGKSFWKAGDLHLALGTFVISFVFFLGDEFKIYCNPHYWLTGHSIWHLGTAMTLYFYGKWRFRSA